MRTPPRVRGGLRTRVAALFVGCFCIALGIVLLLQSGLGLTPWDVLHQGIDRHSPLSFGQAGIAVGLALLLVAWLLGARPGFGTAVNAITIGLYIDALTGPIPDVSDGALAERIAFMLGGIAVFGTGTTLYLGAAMGAGPRDAVMIVGVARTRLSFRVVRAALEAAALASGWALGGTVGVGTLVFALAIGPWTQLVFSALARSSLGYAPLVTASTASPETPR